MNGLLDYLSPDQQRMAQQQATTQGLLGLGSALLQASQGAPGQRRPNLGQVLGQALPVGMQAYQGGIDQTLKQIIAGQQMQELQRKRQQDEAALARQEQIRQTVMQNPDLRAAIPQVLQQTGDVGAASQLAQAAKAMEPEARVMKPGEYLVRGNELLFQVEPETKPVEYIRQDLGNSVAFIDPTSLKTVKVVQKDRDQKDLSSGEDTVRKEFLGQAKPYIEISQAYRKIEEATKSPSAAGDVSLVFAFMKILDPGSVVREGEFATAQNAGGIPDRVRAQYNAAISGQKLAPAQRADFLNQAKNLARSQKQMFESQLLPQYQYISQQRGYDVNKVISNPFGDLKLEAAPTPAAAPAAGRKPLGSIFGKSGNGQP